MPYPSTEMIGDIFIYLLENGEPISYWRAPASKFSDPNPSHKWCILQADKAIGKITDDFNAGMI